MTTTPKPPPPFGFWKCKCGGYTQYLAIHCKHCGKLRDECEDK